MFKFFLICVINLFESCLTFLIYVHTHGTKNEILFFSTFPTIESGMRGWMCLMCANTQNMGVIIQKYFDKPNSKDFIISRSQGVSKIYFFNFNILAKKKKFAKIFGGNPNMRVYNLILIFLEKLIFFIFILSMGL